MKKDIDFLKSLQVKNYDLRLVKTDRSDPAINKLFMFKGSSELNAI
jgi:hypothetical protein